MAIVHYPDMDEWKMETFPEILHDFILEQIDSNYHEGEDLFSRKEKILKAVKEDIDQEVFYYFERNRLIQAEYRSRYNPLLGVYTHEEEDVDLYDVPEEYYELDSLCENLPEMIENVMTEFLAEKMAEKIERTTQEALDS